MIIIYKDSSVYNYYFWILDNYNNYTYFNNNIYYMLINNYNMYIKNRFSYILAIFKNKKSNTKFIDILKFRRNYLNYNSLTLKLTGLGYKVCLYIKKNTLLLFIGYSHRILLNFPKEIQYIINKEGTLMTLSSINNRLLTNIIAKIKTLKKTNPYNGSGVRLLSDLFIPKSYKK